MALVLEFTARAAGELEALPPHDADRIVAKLEWLAAHPEARVESLAGLPPRYAGLLKYRVGVYRVLFWLEEDKLLVARVGHRSKIYKDLR